MMASLLLNLDSDCEMTVFPQPKAPGTAQVPPSTLGKMPSMTRRPVVSAALPGSFSTTGRGRRTGHRWHIFSSYVRSCASLYTSKTVSSTPYWSLPSLAAPWILETVPYTLGGHMILWLWMISFSNTSPKMSPPEMGWPSRRPAAGEYCQAAVRLSRGTSTPRGMNTSFELWKMSSSGRWIPSKIVPMMPGPSSTDKGAFVRSTGSPTVSPDVSSYT
mmetsp:Transcript_7003/g.9837  ORF Transcript_7003/g.9837 Transcript_7003/m.9837 type:complete len:217 (-) Transcript_7003:278-928(-)